MKICVPIIAKKTSLVIQKMQEAQNSHADLMEIWCGEVEDLDLPKIISSSNLPLILNCKSPDEHGNFLGSAKERLKILSSGALLGVTFCDFGINNHSDIIAEFLEFKKQNKLKVDLIISAHFWRNTPNLPSLLNIVGKMIKMHADIVKIATMPKENRDLITVLRLAENLQKKRIRHITISMGNPGAISRIIVPQLFSGECTFAPIKKSTANAPGQLSISEIHKIIKILKI